MGKQKEAILKGLSNEQREAAETVDRDVLVRAGAGSGKTGTLVARYLLLLDENRDWRPADITAVTFTRKAAREMQSRIRKRMMELASSAGDDTEEKRFWLEHLNGMDSANIGTVHSLCGRILRAHPAEAGLDPAFSVLDENNAAVITGRIVEETISRISADPDHEALLNLYDGNRLTKILTDMLKDREKADTAMTAEEKNCVSYLKDKAAAFLFDSEYADHIAEYRMITDEPDFLKKTKTFGEHLVNMLSGYDHACQAFRKGEHPADCMNYLHEAFSGWTLKTRKDGYEVNAIKIREALREGFPFLVKDYSNPYRDIKWYKEFWEQYDRAEASLRKIWPELRDEYMKVLDSTGLIDFDAMESMTLKLLRDLPEVRDIWTNRIKALLVDEFQDTNNSQAELFSLLDPSHKHLFAVGDKKQSIYGFRGTNAALFDRRRDEVLADEGKLVLLNATYRTEPELLSPMGGLLDKVMADSGLFGKDHYAAYEPMTIPENRRDKEDPLPKDQPCVEILLGDIQDKKDDPHGEIIGRMLAERLTEMMSDGLIHTWNDAVILCRNSNDFKQFEDALEAKQIPYVTVAGKGYYDRQEIREILNNLRAAENPHDNAL